MHASSGIGGTSKQQSAYKNNDVQFTSVQAKQPEKVCEESKAPAGKASDSPSSLKLLVLADSTASFYKANTNGSTTELIKDTTLPSFQGASIAQFAPLRGLQAAIVDEFGLHLVDMTTGKETLLLAYLGIANLEYSPCDTFIVLCEKHNPQQPGGHMNL